MRSNVVRRALGLALLLPACAGGQAWAADAGPEIRVLSGRADLVTGGDTLVQVVPPARVKPGALRIDVDGRDVGAAFAVRGDGRYLGLVGGLKDGANLLTARAPGRRGAQLTLVNHPRGGPLLSGPQIQPWRCAAGAQDAQCNRPAEHAFVYKSARSGRFEPYDRENPPDDVARTTTDEGVTVPYVVRVETGAIDRDEYRVAVLYDPERPWTPWDPQPAFNHKLVITHGASCNTAYEQAEAPDVLDDTALSRGFAVMSHALDNAGHNCNVALQAEALIMTKEHVVETLGELRYTIGTGCSGGALTQQQVANAYPGVYQGITPACSFPDTWSGRMLYEDYSLLRRYFEAPTRWEPGVAWTEDDVAAVWGHPNHVNAVTYNTAIAPLLDPSRSCPGVDDADVYDASANPGGVRCSLQDYMVNVFGRRPGDGFAGRPWDNTGVEYGRKALAAGKITPGQFADVNLKAGGRDIDYEPQPQRAVADRPALARAYRSGAVNQGTHLDKVAIIDLRGPDPGAFHDVYRTYALRARLEREHGHADNQVLWRGPVPLFGDPDYQAEAIVAMDAWLAAIESDRRELPLARKVVEDRPAAVAPRCTDGAGNDLPVEACDATVESYSTARIEAGMPFTDDVIKCELKPPRRSDYLPARFSEAEWAKLREAFPGGVCDYGRPGVDREPTVAWMTYGGGPGGAPLGSPPRSQPAAAKRRCVSRRRFRVRLRGPRGQKLRSARVQVDGRRAKVRRRGGRLVALIDLRGRPRGIVRVRIVGRTRAGRRVVSQRRYRTCAPKRRAARRRS